MSEPLVTVTYTLTREQADWLREQGEQQGRRSASSVLRELLEPIIAAERREQFAEAVS